MLAASDILNLFSSAADLKNVDKLKSADTLAGQLEKAVAEIKVEADKSSSDNIRQYISVYENLNRFLGEYRSFRSSRDGQPFKDMARYYNEAVDEQRYIGGR